MLDNFFRINMPYGIAKNEKGEWMAFNREYLPLGYNNQKLQGNPGSSYLDLPVYANYRNVKEKLLLELAGNENALQRGENGDITKVFLYNDGTNPVNQNKDKKHLWDKYFEKLRKLSKLSVSET